MAGCREKPAWIHLPGLRSTRDIGNGMGIKLAWGEAASSDPDKQVHYNIYFSSTRFGVFDSAPEAMSTNLAGVINVPPGKLHYFAVRAIEYDPLEFDITELTQISPEVYQYPPEQTLQADIDAYGATVEVEDASEYPSKGFLQIGFEVLQYSSRSSTEFFIEDTQRGAFQTNIDTHSAGATVRMFRGIEDGNTLIHNETATWHEANGTPRNVDAIGEYAVDEDGYKSEAKDNITPDLSIYEDQNVDFPNYDYTGYHKPSLQSTFSGDCVGSYVGGEFNGGRGLFFQDRNLARLDAMLQVTGEPVLLLKRIWSGKRCRCFGVRREHPKTRCAFCYGTGFAGGYSRYVNPRAISERWTNEHGFILTRITPYSDDLESVGDQGLRHPSELTAWTITVPVLKDRDIIIRYNRDPVTGEFIEEFRYEILDVTRNKLFFGDTGKQEFRMRRHDKTDVIYQFDTGI